MTATSPTPAADAPPPPRVDRVMHDIAQHLRLAMGAHAVAIALVPATDPTALALAHQTGFDAEGEGLETRLAVAWREAFDSGAIIAGETGDGLALTAPLRAAATDGAAEAPLGAVTLRFGGLDASHRAPELRRTLAVVASFTAAAIERAAQQRRAERRQRLDGIAEVAAGVAHELRNPLLGIGGAAQLLRFRLTEDPVVEKNVGRILREVERLNAVVAALLDYGRPAPLRLAPADPDVVWDEVLEQQRGQLESKALVLQRERASPPCTCSLDAGQLAQLFAHLLANAIDAAPEGTDLALTSRALPTGAWSMQLVDAGPPVSRETLDRAFDLFFSTRPGGTGVGLALCRRIADDHGGTVTLEHLPTAGTVATVTLPPSRAT